MTEDEKYPKNWYRFHDGTYVSFEGLMLAKLLSGSTLLLRYDFAESCQVSITIVLSEFAKFNKAHEAWLEFRRAL